MLEELKLVVEMFEELTDVAIWAIAWFVAFKLVLHLTTVGAWVFVFYFAVRTFRDCIMKEMETTRRNR